jgi:hypothetical protein
MSITVRQFYEFRNKASKLEEALLQEMQRERERMSKEAFLGCFERLLSSL